MINTADSYADGGQNPESNPGEYTVGRGRPPKQGQWKPGQSGNPNGGRRRGDPDTYGELIDSVLSELIPAIENGKTRSKTKRGALVETIVDRGIAGHPACENILIMFERPDLSRPSGELVFVEADTDDEVEPKIRELERRKRQPRNGLPSPAGVNPPGGSAQPGSSSRRGRQRNDAPFAELIKRELKRRIKVEENGKTKWVTKREAWMRRLAHSALNGNARALRTFVKVYRPTEPMPKDRYFCIVGGR
jgi:hypothetical protein